MTDSNLPLAPAMALRALCAMADLPPGACAGFEPADLNTHAGLFAVHGPTGPVVYLNLCPHLGVPLDWRPGRFLAPDGTLIVCATHGAEFRIDTGECLRGPCRGDALTLVPSIIVSEALMVPADAGRYPAPKDFRRTPP